MGPSKPGDTSVLSLFKGKPALKIKGCCGAKRTLVNWKVMPVYAWYFLCFVIALSLLWPFLANWGAVSGSISEDIIEDKHDYAVTGANFTIGYLALITDSQDITFVDLINSATGRSVEEYTFEQME